MSQFPSQLNDTHSYDSTSSEDSADMYYPSQLKDTHLHDSTSSEDSVDSTDSDIVQGIAGLGLQNCNNSLGKKNHHGNIWKKKIRNQAYWQWINSWHKGMGIEVPPKYLLDNDIRYYCVNTDGYFRKRRRGRHGVIIRDNVGNPIVASAVVSENIVSCRYQQLLGMARGIELALEYSLLDIELFCNAKHVVRLVHDALQTVDGCNIHSSIENSFDVICKKCVMSLTEEDYDFVFPLVKKIAEMVPNLCYRFIFNKCSRKQNRAADFLAKNAAPRMELLWPSKFPNAFKKILCKDYFESEPHGLPIFM